MASIELLEIESAERLNRAAVSVAVKKWRALFWEDFEPRWYVDRLLVVSYFSAAEANLIREEKLKEKRVYEFADCLASKDPEVYVHFLRCLEQNGQRDHANNLRSLYDDALSQGFGSTPVTFQYPSGFLEGEKSAMSVARDKYVEFALEKFGSVADCLQFAVLHGLSGVGKTQIAMQIASAEKIKACFADGIIFCHLQKHKKSEDFWCELREIFQSLLAELSGHIFGAENAIKNRHLLEAYVAQCATLLADKKVLVILDDIWTGVFESDKSTANFFLRLNASILCTSMDGEWSTLSYISRRCGFEFSEIEVLGFTRAESDEFVSRWNNGSVLEQNATSEENATQSLLYENTDGHPLHMEIVLGSYPPNSDDILHVFEGESDCRSPLLAKRLSFVNTMTAVIKSLAANGCKLELQILIAGAVLTLSDLSWFVLPWFPFGRRWCVTPSPNAVRDAFERLKRHHLISSYAVPASTHEAASFRMHAMIRAFLVHLVEKRAEILARDFGVSCAQQRLFYATRRCVKDCLLSTDVTPGMSAAGLIFRFLRYRCLPFFLPPRRVQGILSRYPFRKRFFILAICFSLIETVYNISLLSYIVVMMRLLVKLSAWKSSCTWKDCLEITALNNAGPFFTAFGLISLVGILSAYARVALVAHKNISGSMIIGYLRLWCMLVVLQTVLAQFALFRKYGLYQSRPFVSVLYVVATCASFTLMVALAIGLALVFNRQVAFEALREEVLLLNARKRKFFRWNAFRVPIWLCSATANYLLFLLFLLKTLSCNDHRAYHVFSWAVFAFLSASVALIFSVSCMRALQSCWRYFIHIILCLIFCILLGSNILFVVFPTAGYVVCAHSGHCNVTSFGTDISTICCC